MTAPYVVAVAWYTHRTDLAAFTDFFAALDFAVSYDCRRDELVTIRNVDREDVEGPMWDGEGVVSRHDNGLTEDERDLAWDAVVTL